MTNPAALVALGAATPPHSQLHLGRAADAVVYVSTGGVDTESGNTWGTAKATIGAAIAALPAAGGTVELGAGTFTGAVTLDRSVILRGQGPATILTIANNTNAPVVYAQSTVTGAVVTRLKIDGNKANNASPGPSGNHGVLIEGHAAEVTLCTISNCYGAGVHISGANAARCAVTFNDISGCSVPVQVTAASDNDVAGNTCTANDYGIFLYNNGNTATPSSRNRVRGNLVSGCTGTNGALAQAAGISLTGAPYSIVQGNELYNNATRGIEAFSGSTGSIIANNVVVSNGVSTGASGIDTGPDVHLTVNGNHCEGNGGAGIFLSGDKYAIVTGNRCLNNGQTAATRTSGSGNGITLNEDSGTGADPVVGCVITGNICMDTQGTKTQQYGIREWQGVAGYYQRNQIFGNNLRGNAVGDQNLISDTDLVYGNTLDAGTWITDRTLVVHGNVASDQVRLVNTSPTTVTDRDQFIRVDATFGAQVLNLPTAANRGGKSYTFKRIDASGNAITLTPTGGQTIDGAATKTIVGQWTTVRILSDGTNWLIL